MTGAQFYDLLQQKIDKAYSAYIDTTKANRLIEETILRLCEKLYSTLDTQKEYDELWSLLVKDEVKSVANQYFDLSGLSRTYMHMFRVGFTFDTLLGNLTRTSTGSGPFTTVFTSTGHSARKGDVIKVGANTGTVVSYTKTKFTVTSAATLVTGSVYLVRFFEGSEWFSDRKKDSYHAPTIFSPKYQFQNRISGSNNVKSLYIYPQCTSLTIDYMALPTLATGHIFLSTDATAITAYTEKFLYRLADECVFTYAEQVRDAELRQNSAQSIMINP
jgi:hypothetical protein